MRMTSLFSSRTARFLAVSTIIAGMIVVTGSFVSPTLSCPGPPPQPLRTLYLRSESIVIARVGKSEVLKEENASEDEGESGPTQIRTALLVSSTLKGEHQPVVYVRHNIYGDYKDKLSSASADDTLLVFLVRVPEMDGYYVDMNYGLKILPEADLKVYVSRIEELASIMKSGNPTDTEIVEWLVRCAEERATRWEGAFELAMSHYLLEQQADQNTESTETQVSEDEATEAPLEGGYEQAEIIFTNSFDSEYPKSAFAKLLTASQKNRLATALVNSDKLSGDDYYLLDLVQRWDDARLVPFLLTQLDLISRPDQKEQAPAYFTENLMTIVADKLGDDALKEMVKRLTENLYNRTESYDDEDESSGDSEVAQDVSEQKDAAADAAAEAAAEAAEAAAGQQRLNAELQHFVTLAMSTVPKTESEAPSESPAPEQP